MTHSAENDAVHEVRRAMRALYTTVPAEVARDVAERVESALAQVWNQALDHVWELADPAHTIVYTQASKYLVTEADIEQAKRENPYVFPPGEGRANE